MSYVVVNDWALSAAAEDVRSDVGGWILRGFTTRLPLLFVGSIPVRYEQINALPRALVLLIFASQAALVGLALVGLIVLWRRNRDARLAAALTSGLVAYMAAIHFAFYTDARYGLPAWPVLLMSALAGGSAALDELRRRVERTRGLPFRRAATADG